MNTLDQLLAFLGKVGLLAGGSAAVAYALFRYMGKKWIDGHFAQQLEDFKHRQAMEIARLKVEVESVLSGALKLQEREFSVLPEAWAKMHEAYELTRWVSSPLQSYPDISRMDTLELAEHLDASELPASQRMKISNLDARYRNDEYHTTLDFYRLGKARNAIAEFQRYLSANGIFLTASIKKQLCDMSALLWGTWSTMHTHKQYKGDFKMKNEAWDKLQEEGPPLHAGIEKAIEDRLHAHGECMPPPVE